MGHGPVLKIPLSIVGPSDCGRRVAVERTSCESGPQGRVDGVALLNNLAQSRSLNTKWEN